jgi:hypothetical protein
MNRFTAEPGFFKLLAHDGIIALKHSAVVA